MMMMMMMMMMGMLAQCLVQPAPCTHPGLCLHPPAFVVGAGPAAGGHAARLIINARIMHECTRTVCAQHGLVSGQHHGLAGGHWNRCACITRTEEPLLVHCFPPAQPPASQ